MLGVVAGLPNLAVSQVKGLSAAPWYSVPLALWLECTDLGVLSRPAGDDLVTTWVDKGGLGQSATHANGCVYTPNVTNGLPGLRFINPNRLLGSSFAGVDQAFTVFVVGSFLSGAGTNGRLFAFGGNNISDNASGGFGIFRDGSNQAVKSVAGGANKTTFSITYGTPFLFVARSDGAGGFSSGLNNTALTDTTYTGTFAFIRYAVAGGLAPGGSLSSPLDDGTLFEIVVLPAAVTGDTLAAYRAYLCTKWGTA